eukprot:CAMPEP_0206530522 /NCGR_PEP_ID=MMETSP0325_2-20121206/3226_1 /ASSEMBLY_ACC=CAM_ASM_000347 /TAXON_ID=2866 /ORGANISM="Crypthecodinium cohnii, Strain Seligo" /LENGTH=588 /DNA_ID=CAMNT_0054026603 /DNA_START=153 /DNA_END=1919 /DNA_ORIENTATION=+
MSGVLGKKQDSDARPSSVHSSTATSEGDRRTSVARQSNRSTKSAVSYLSRMILDDDDDEDDVPWDLVMMVHESTSFGSSGELSRGIRLSKVMRGIAGLFASPAGTLQTYKLSEQTEKIQYFVSHNWSVGRIDKFLALSLAFNFRWAMLATLILTVLTASGNVPTVTDPSQTPPVAGFLGRLLLLPASGLFFFVGHDLGALFGWKGPLTFLDKACIHQVDPELKEQGIQKLGAFLRISERMLTLYSDVYLLKLWTIYEVANFLALKSVDRLEVIPVHMPRIVFLALPVGFLYGLLTMLLRTFTGISSFGYIILVFTGTFYMLVFRRWARHKKDTQQRLRNFEVRDCICAVESDRQVVYQKIATLMRFTKRVDRLASVDEALTAFNMEVRRQMPSAFKMIFGWTTLTYEHYIFMGFAIVAPTSVDYLGRLQEEEHGLQALKRGCLDLMWILTFYPISFYLAEIIASRWLHWKGVWQCFIFLTAYLIVGVPSVSLHMLFSDIASRPEDDEIGVMIMVGSFMVSSGITFLVVLTSRLVRARKGKRNGPHALAATRTMSDMLDSAASMGSRKSKTSFGSAVTECDDNQSVYSV